MRCSGRVKMFKHVGHNRLLSLGGREGPGRQINGDYELLEANGLRLLKALHALIISIWLYIIYIKKDLLKQSFTLSNPSGEISIWIEQKSMKILESRLDSSEQLDQLCPNFFLHQLALCTTSCHLDDRSRDIQDHSFDGSHIGSV